ncbi:TPA: DNA cytosine methyltransferase, partial [Pasteurella multocida]
NVPCVALSVESVVRKLTPRECERLQGFPDDYTKIPYRNKSIDECPDSPRYKAIGNSMAVPVMDWIGLRLIDYINQDSTQ